MGREISAKECQGCSGAARSALLPIIIPHFLSLISKVTKALSGAIEQGQLPHLLFYGPPGTGKTSTILAVTRMLYHPDIWFCSVSR